MIINQKDWYIQSNGDTVRIVQGARWNNNTQSLEPIHADRDIIMIELVNNTAGTGYISFQRADATAGTPSFVEILRFDSSGNILSGTNYIELGEIGTPSNPSANKLRIYTRDDSGVTKLAIKDSAGTETILGAGDVGAIDSMTEKTTPVSADLLIVADSAASYARKKVQIGNLSAAGYALTTRKLDDFGTPDDNTDLNATTTYHGLLPKLNNSATQFLNGQGSWATPSGVTDHGALTGLSDDTHTQYIKDSEFTLDSQILVGTGSGTFAAESGATLRTSIGVGTGDSPQLTAVNVGHASDTTLARSSAGVISVAGTAIPKGTGTANEIVYWSATNTVGTLTTATYPSLTELSYVKGVTSAIQTQLANKSNWDAAYTHVSNNGTNHSYINQSVTTAASPTFAGLTSNGNITMSGGQYSISIKSNDALAFRVLEGSDVYLKCITTTGDTSISIPKRTFIADSMAIGNYGSLALDATRTVYLAHTFTDYTNSKCGLYVAPYYNPSSTHTGAKDIVGIGGYNTIQGSSNWTNTVSALGLDFGGAYFDGTSGGPGLVTYGCRVFGCGGVGGTFTAAESYGLYIKPTYQMFAGTFSVGTVYGLFVEAPTTAHATTATYQNVIGGTGTGTGIWFSSGTTTTPRVWASSATDGELGYGTTSAFGWDSSSGPKLGFFGVTKIVRASAYTQTYSTADKTHAALTACYSGNALTAASGTADGTVADVGASFNRTTLNNNFQECATSCNNLRTDLTDLKQLVNSIIDDLQAYGLLQ
jgi:hypothetical protein